MTVRLAALLVISIGVVATVSVALVLILLSAMGQLDREPPWYAYAVAFLSGCILSFGVGLLASYATRWSGFVTVEWPKKD